MASFALLAARTKRDQARDTLHAHDQACPECHVSHRIRCDTGRALLHAYWDHGRAVHDEAARLSRPAEGQLTFEEATDAT
jgi:hypothetical protein